MKIKAFAAAVAIMMTIPAYSVTLNTRDMLSSVSIKQQENQTYKVEVCEKVSSSAESSCSSDIINMEIIESRLDEKIEAMTELFSSQERIDELKLQMENEIIKNGSSEITLMPGATLNANNVGMLDWLFEMAQKSVSKLTQQRDGLLDKSEGLLNQIDNVQGKTMTISQRAYSKKLEELIGTLHIELD